jgi:hypothetical protein
MKPFLSGRKVHNAQALHAHATHPCTPVIGQVKPAPSATSPGPNVEIIREGDKVMRIIITCTCGERVEVNCLYAAGS